MDQLNGRRKATVFFAINRKLFKDYFQKKSQSLLTGILEKHYSRFKPRSFSPEFHNNIVGCATDWLQIEWEA
ncbi:hypothetical protein OAL01_04125 [Rubripirellula sp.]|nr:hypothetical protein [Rubripirellula sp.]